jgi:hypothetical protein
MPYVLEVQKFYPNPFFNFSNSSKKFTKHIGYIDEIFSTKKEASEYYNRFNPHMRSLNAYNTWRSDWDPDTKLMYIVRRYFERK